VQRRPFDDEDRARLGRVLRDFRQRAGLTLEALGAAAAVTKNYLADLEAGIRIPAYLVLGRVVRALGITWAEFGATLDGAR
jgi:transcriptional regulator with XRE-family HTH domain